MDKVNLQKMIDEGYISVQKHPEADLFIYNYTQRCQFDRVWNPETLQCRGLIMDSAGNVVARPFPKFFNLEELENVPAEAFTVWEKYDGSLGILYWIGDQAYLATRGSFTSEQAIKGTEMLKDLLRDHSHWLNKSYTYLFEIIYPSNRIVVDYQGREELILLSVIETATGKELPISSYPFKKAERYDGITDITKIKENNRDNAEGFVIHFESGMRCKVKYAEYVRLHRLITGVNERRIWDVLRNGESLDELLDRVPDEFYQWVTETVKKLKQQYLAYVLEAEEDCMTVSGLETRKEQADWLKNRNPVVRSVVFAMLDEKPYEHIIWKNLKPKAEKPFKIEI